MIENEQKTEFIEHWIYYQKSSILCETFHMDAFNVDIHLEPNFLLIDRKCVLDCICYIHGATSGETNKMALAFIKVTSNHR